MPGKNERDWMVVLHRVFAFDPFVYPLIVMSVGGRIFFWSYTEMIVAVTLDSIRTPRRAEAGFRWRAHLGGFPEDDRFIAEVLAASQAIAWEALGSEPVK
jgi:hypothetical protein